MDLYIVKQGDTPDSIAQKFGLKQWKQIYDHPDNGALRNARGPNEVKADDRVLIPHIAESTVQAGVPQKLIVAPGKLVLPPVTFDAHMHIMSGNCTPLPPLYAMMKDKGVGILESTKATRKTINGLGRGMAWFSRNVLAVVPAIGEFSHRTTLRIGLEAVKLNDGLFQDHTVYVPPPPGGMVVTPSYYTVTSVYGSYPSTQAIVEAKESFVGISIALTMDMDFCHLDGYAGEPVYQKEVNTKGKQVYVYYRRTNSDRSRKGEKIQTDPSELKAFETWSQQIIDTEFAAAAFPFRVLPLYHFEPRRYIKQADKTVPFKKVATPEQAGAFAGFKMYTPQGYMPADPHQPVSDVLKWFFKECASKGTPLMTHCTPAGFYTHDRKFYLDNEPDAAVRKRYLPPEADVKKADERIQAAKKKLDLADKLLPTALPGPLKIPLPTAPVNWATKKVLQRQLNNAIAEREELFDQGRLRYFYENFVHPEAWRKVLTSPGCSSLRLCLAHFASDKSFWNVEKGVSVLTDGQKLTYTKSWILSLVELCRDFENVYTDISYLPLMDDEIWKLLGKILIDYPWMRQKIMYGTDWYMITAEPVEYGDWHRNTIAGLERAQKMEGMPQFNLFHQFAIVNPSRFYRLVEIAPKLKEGLKGLVSKHKQAIEERKQSEKGLEAVDVSKLEEQIEMRYLTLMRLQAPLEDIKKRGGLASGPIFFTETPSKPSKGR